MKWLSLARTVAVGTVCGLEVAQADVVSLTLTSPPPVLTLGEDGLYRAAMEGFCPTRSPGDPAVPFTTARILVPPDIDWQTLALQVLSTRARPLAGRYDMAPSPPALAAATDRVVENWGTHANLVDGRNRDVYGHDIDFPAAFVELLPHGQMRKWKYVRIGFNPLRYNPVTGRILHCQAVEIELTFDRDPALLDPIALGDTVNDQAVAGMVENYEEALAWYPTPRAGARSGGGHDYVIVTRQAIVDGSNRLNDFITRKQLRGHRVRVVTEADYQPLSGPPPNSDCEKIRQWLIDNYAGEGIVDVLLIGDPTPDGAHPYSLPMKMTWANSLHADDRSAPTDYYYADLTGNWDPDGDQYYATFSDYTTNGGVDLAAEVFVGRIPVYDADYAALDHILDKMSAYANEAQTGWRKSCLLPASFLQEAYSSSHWTEQMCDDFLSGAGYEIWRMYQQGNDVCGLIDPYPSEEELLGGTAVRDRWTAQSWGIVAWGGHGSRDGAQVGPNGCDDGYLFNSWSAASLDDTHPAFVHQASCNNGYPEYATNLQYSLLKQGAIAAVGASRVSFYSKGDLYGMFDDTPGSMAVAYQYVHRLVDGLPAGQALYEGKLAASAYIGSYSVSLMNALIHNLYGDPAIGIATKLTDPADLQFQEATLAVADTAVDVSLTIVNQSSAGYADASTAAVYLSPNAVVSTADYRIGGMTVPEKPPGGVFYTGLQKDVRFVSPPIPPGEYFVGAILDVDDTVYEEGGENNNAYVFPSPKVTVPPGPDAPANVQASDGILPYVQVSWDPSPHATHYRLFRNDFDGTFGAQPVTDWIPATQHDDLTAQAGQLYYYFVKAAFSSNGYQSSGYSVPANRGYRVPDVLVEDVVVTVQETAYYQFTEPDVGWCVVGLRGYAEQDAWGLGLYSDATYQIPLATTVAGAGFHFVVADLNHLAPDTFAVQAERIDGHTASAGIELEGPDDVLQPGTNSIYWTLQEEVRIYELPLTPGTYQFELGQLSGSADIAMALLGSVDGEYLKTHQQFLGSTEGNGECFGYTVTTADDYALCLWRTDGYSADLEIRISTLPPGVWTGAQSADWHDAANWEDLLVPAASVDVTLPPGRPHYPHLTANGVCRNLTVESGASLAVTGATLDMGGSLTVRGHLDLNDNAIVDVGQHVRWEAGSTADMVFLSLIDVGGNWTFEAGAKVDLTDGAVRFVSGQPAFIRSHDSNCRLYLVQNSKPGAFLAVTGTSTAPLRIRDLLIDNSAFFMSFSPHPVVIEGNLRNLGNLQTYNGTLVFAGDPGTTPLSLRPGDYLHGLVVDTTGHPLRIGDEYANRLQVTGDLVIAGGGLDAQDIHLDLGGSWSNALGNAGFVGGTGTVSLVGASDQAVYGSTTFHALRVDKGGGSVDLRGPMTIETDVVLATATTVVHDALAVAGTLDLDAPGAALVADTGAAITAAGLDLGGALICRDGATLAAADLVDAAIHGAITVEGGQVDLHQGTAPIETLDLEGALTIHGGVLNIHGGSAPLRWTARTQDLVLTMTGGLLNVADRGISIFNGAGALTADITGGTIRTAEGFDCDRTDFQPAGGRVEMGGSAAATLDVPAPSHLHTLQVGGPGGVTATADLRLTGDCLLRGGSFTPPAVLEVGGTWSNGVGTAAFREGSGLVRFFGANPADLLTDETFYDVTVDKTAADYDALELMDNLALVVRHDLTLRDGALELNDQSRLEIGGDLLIEKGAGLNANDEGVAITVGGGWQNRNVDYSTTHGFAPGDPIYGSSTVTFTGVATQHLDTDAAEEIFHHLVIDQAGGAFRPAVGIRVQGTCTISAGTWRASQAGLTHTFHDDVVIGPAGVVNDDSSTVRFEGLDHQLFDDQSGTALFGDIVVAREDPTSMLELASPLHCAAGHTLTVDQGVLALNGQSLRCEGNLLVDGGGTLSVDGGASVAMGNGSSLIVGAYGRLAALGTPRANAVIRGDAGGAYALVIGGRATIQAAYATFLNLGADGLVVDAAGSVDPVYAFTSCTFADGAAGGALLTVYNGQELVITRAAFPTDAGAGARNVRKTRDQGEITFVAATGNFGGAAYEDDPHRRVNWVTGAPATVTINGPAYCTRGGRYPFEATVAGGHLLTPLTFDWVVADHLGYQHEVGDLTDSRNLSWSKAGSKRITVTVSNSEGEAETSHDVTVMPLALAGITVVTNGAGGGPAVDVVLGGTSADSRYRVEFTAPGGTAWQAAEPDGAEIPGADGATSWRDVGGPDRDLVKSPAFWYRTVLIE